MVCCSGCNEMFMVRQANVVCIVYADKFCAARDHEAWRAANRAGAISCVASHLRVKSACKPTHSPTPNSPTHIRRPSRDGPRRRQHCVLSPLRQDTIMYCVKGVNQKSFSGSKAVAVRTPVRTSSCQSLFLESSAAGCPPGGRALQGGPAVLGRVAASAITVWKSAL